MLKTPPDKSTSMEVTENSNAAKPLRRARFVGIILMLSGMLSGIVGLLIGGWERFAAGYLLGFTFLWILVLGGLFFVALQHVTNSMWSLVVRRLGEALAGQTWWVAAAFIPVAGMAFYLGQGHLPGRTPSAAQENHGAEATEAAAGIPETPSPHAKPIGKAEAGPNRFKEIYYHFWFWLGRTAFYFLIWFAYARFFVRRSLEQDSADLPAAWQLRARMKRASAPFMLLFALTLSFAAIDWLMRLQGDWFSTIFPVYIFAGLMVTSHAVVSLIALWLRRAGMLPLRGEHLYTMGGLLFGFSCFWAYIAFSQFLLIWYGNLPEEVDFYLLRTRGGWTEVTLLLISLRFIIPFMVLLGRPAKSNAKILGLISVLIIAGQWLDLYWLIVPPQAAHPDLGLSLLGPTIFWVGILVLAFLRFLQKHPVQASGDPVYDHSRHLELD